MTPTDYYSWVLIAGASSGFGAELARSSPSPHEEIVDPIHPQRGAHHHG